jgi:hypothetical protein
MTEITKEHVEWAVVDRMCQMLVAPPSKNFGVTETYALFTTTLCWVLQHIRIEEAEDQSGKHQAARQLHSQLKSVMACDPPWSVHTNSTPRVDQLNGKGISVPTSKGFEGCSVAKLLIALRNALAHGDSRNVLPFNQGGLLAGFTFSYSNAGREITLLQSDMQRIGSELARLYCNAVQQGAERYDGDNFKADAASIREIAA